MSVKRPTFVVAAAIVDRLEQPTRLLAARRTLPPALAGQWELPGGKAEPGESPVHALHRELKEELGVRVRLGPEIIGPLDGHWPLTLALTLRLWWAELVEGEPAPLQDHDRVRWLETGQWLDVAWIPADRAAVAEMIRQGSDPARGASGG